MNFNPLENADFELIEEASKIIKRFYFPEKHVVGAALRTQEGEIITGIHLEAFVGRVAVCAEAIALGKALSEGYKDFTTVVAVYHPNPSEEDNQTRVVTPCGMCRELLLDYCPSIEIIIPHPEKNSMAYVKCAGADLLPFKYQR